jgi:hypothetical protein
LSTFSTAIEPFKGYKKILLHSALKIVEKGFLALVSSYFRQR